MPVVSAMLLWCPLALPECANFVLESSLFKMTLPLPPALSRVGEQSCCARGYLWGIVFSSGSASRYILPTGGIPFGLLQLWQDER